MHSTTDYSKIFSALGDRTRYQLYRMLGKNSQACVSQLASQLGITPACVSQHMKILSEVGLVTRLRDGQRVCYKISTNSNTSNTISRLIFKTKAKE